MTREVTQHYYSQSLSIKAGRNLPDPKGRGQTHPPSIILQEACQQLGAKSSACPAWCLQPLSFCVGFASLAGHLWIDPCLLFSISFLVYFHPETQHHSIPLLASVHRVSSYHFLKGRRRVVGGSCLTFSLVLPVREHGRCSESVELWPHNAWCGVISRDTF